ncbi:NAD(P)/FAD-dependent oxidoreductase [Mucilaginibacter sp. HC2]|uniref:NAD(P)/FAD-dependent oxidoreductase n=1 Tax=Mucilaginibacter inviolabilis TaxID=2714892 RepID=UPI00140CD510|nr:NAD(P)/FAD-dependent oxidoreductase [Mucilaginibacter inviolabilis]NHA02653.1 NAD(P)/FAD-dependent oxidoreductase [Mucilaginibacter inviolabilis]
MEERNENIATDICIVGAGPVGLFAVFEAGLLKMRCHVIDALPQVGGQLSEIYPHKPIYDIPGYPQILGQELVDRLMEQVDPFRPGFTLGERVETINRNDDDSLTVITSEHTTVKCKVLVIAGGLGCFEPRKPAIDGLSEFEGKGVAYMVRNPESLRGRNVVLAGGGDSALDWAIFLADIAAKVTLVHRGDTFRGSPDSAGKVFELAKAGRIDLRLHANVTALHGDGHLQELSIHTHQLPLIRIAADHFIPLFGLTPKLGPIADWGLNISQSAISVNVADYSTNADRIYAIGDINTYPGKLKLILCGFHEAALAMQSAFKHVYPDEKLSFKYTTVYGINAF